MSLGSNRCICDAGRYQSAPSRFRRADRPVRCRGVGDVRLGLMIDGEDGWTIDAWVRLVVTAEEAGFTSVLCSDHLRHARRPGQGGLDPYVACAVAAHATSRITLGTLVSPIWRRPPVELARTAATLDAIAPGRVEIGVGLGSDGRELADYGYEVGSGATAYARLDEYLELMHLLLGDGVRGPFRGRFHSVATTVLPPTPSVRPRFIVGKRGGRRSVAVAARWADEYNTVAATPPAVAAIRQTLDEAAAATGRTVGLSVMTDALVGGSPSELARRAARHEDICGWIAADRLLAAPPPSFLVGDVPEIGRRIDAYARAGADRVLLKIADVADLDAVRELGALAHAGENPQRGAASSA